MLVSSLAHPVLGVPGSGAGTADSYVTDVPTAVLDEIVEDAESSRVCLGRDPEDYFPLVGEHEASQTNYLHEREGCPVVTECLELALRTRSGRFGVWGGASEWERVRIITARVQARRAAALQAVS
jgi:hypothetical protein